MIRCPSCGQDVGSHDACPHCGACLADRMSLRVVKIAAVLLAVLGLAGLWAAAVSAEVPLLRIDQASAATNLAYVRVRGRCARVPSYDPESGYLSFWLDDGTGQVRVAAYRAEARRILDLGRVPALGDQVEVAGTLRVQEDLLTLTINAPEHLRVARADPVARDVGAITPGDQYLRVRVRGEVREIARPYDGLTLVTIHDGTGAIVMALSDNLAAVGGVVPALVVGQPVEVVAAVSLYNGAPQLIPASAADVVLLDRPLSIAAERRTGELTAADVGKLVLIHGTVIGARAFSAGFKYALDDGSGAVTVVVWQDVYDRLPDPAVLAVGAEVQVRGEVSLYRGELEVVPEVVEDVQVLAAALPTATPPATSTPFVTELAGVPPLDTPPVAPAATATPSPAPVAPGAALTPIGALSADRVGEVVTVEGVVIGSASFSAGFKLTLDDGGGRIVLLMWHNLYDACPDAPRLNVGARVRAVGEVGVYEGELQLQPRAGGDVEVIQGAAAWASPREIGSLGEGDAGRRVMVEGRVVRLEAFNSAAKVFLADETGEVMILIWRNVLDRVPRNAALGIAGTRLRVVGVVTVYEGRLEVVPALPYDVVVETGG